MAKTGYIIYNGIKQVFTSGTSVGAVVNPAFSQTFGTATNILAGGVIFQRKILDYTKCALECNIPDFRFAQLSEDNNTLHVRLQNIVGTATIEMSVFPDFRNVSISQNTTVLVTNLDVREYTATQTFYVRAYNTCSPNNTSNYTEVKSATKVPPPVTAPTLTITGTYHEGTDYTLETFKIEGPAGAVVSYASEIIDTPNHGGRAVLRDNNGATYPLSVTTPRSGTITIPSTGILTFSLEYVVTPSRNSNDTYGGLAIDFKYGGITLEPSGYVVISAWAVGAGGSSACFVEGTLITLNNGLQVPIETLYANQTLLSSNIKSLEDTNNVEELFKWSSNILDEIKTTSTITYIEEKEADNTIIINNGLLEATPSHNQLFKRDGMWRFNHIGTVQVGDYLYDINGNEVEVTSVEINNEIRKIYPLTTSTTHTYFANNILTHNKNIIPEEL